MCDKDGTAMPHAASLCGCLQHGANEDAVDAENRSPLHWAGVCQGTGGNRAAGTTGRKGRGGRHLESRAGLTADTVGGNGGS